MSQQSDTMRMVIEFHRRLHLPMEPSPVNPLDVSAELAQLRLDLHAEESNELVKAAWYDRDVTDLADALADIAYGTALTYGIDLDAVLREVHRSNMTKDPGATGKALKGDDYSPPDVARVLQVQNPLF